MGCPFPGMDPFLEGSLWTSFHAHFAVEIARTLNPLLVPKYVAFAERRFVLTLPEIEDGISISSVGVLPDVGVFGSGTAGGAGAAAMTAPLQLETVLPQPTPQYSVAIRDTKNRQLVTAIELLSPWNKHGKGRREYLAKRQRILLSSSHLMEIDLLHSGKRVPMRQPLPKAPYFVLLSRAEKRPITDVWSVQITESLPRVPVPLLPPDVDVILDLQQAFTGCYDSAAMKYVVEYGDLPETKLPPEEMKWMEQNVLPRHRKSIPGDEPPGGRSDGD